MSPRQTKGGERPFVRVSAQCPLCMRGSHRLDRIGVLFEGKTVPRNGGPPASVLSCGDCGHRWHGPPVSDLVNYATRGPVRLLEPPALEDEGDAPLDEPIFEPQDWEP